jgi:DNA mismatch repair ATPase MutL
MKMKKKLAVLVVLSMLTAVFTAPLAVYADESTEPPIDEPVEEPEQESEKEAPEEALEQEPSIEEPDGEVPEEATEKEPEQEEPIEERSEEDSSELSDESKGEGPEDEPEEEVPEDPAEGEVPEEETKQEPPEEEVPEEPVEVEAPEEVPDEETLEEAPEKESTVGISDKTDLEIVDRPDLGLEVLYITYRDRIYNQNTGEGIEGVNIKLTHQETKEIIETVTNTEGWFEVELQEGVYCVVLQRIGFKDLKTTVEVVEK